MNDQTKKLEINGRKLDAVAKAFATDSDAWRWAQSLYIPWEQRDAAEEALGDLRGSGWAVALYEMESGTYYAQAITVNGREAVALYSHCREEGISGLEVKFQPLTA